LHGGWRASNALLPYQRSERGSCEFSDLIDSWREKFVLHWDRFCSAHQTGDRIQIKSDRLPI
jgi:hypothetical protein